MNRIIKYLTCFLIISCQPKTEEVNIDKIQERDSLNSEVFLTKISPDTLLNTDNYLILGEKLTNVKIVKNEEVKNFKGFVILFDYRDDVIIGENVDYKNLKIYRKYHPTTKFEDYRVEVYKGKLAAPDFSTNPGAKQFITRIKNECENGINFAGHYTLVIWGCGSPCQGGVVVNRKTGKIFGGYDATNGTEFKKDSKMIIRNIGAVDMKTNLIEVCDYCIVTHEIWSGTEFKELG